MSESEITLIIRYLDRTAAALDKLVTAVEQMALSQISEPTVGLPTGEPPLPTPPPDLPLTAPTAPLTPTVTVPLPPVTPFAFTGPTAQCPVHHVAWKTVPAGVSKKNGKPYQSFLVCSVQGCEERPRA